MVDHNTNDFMKNNLPKDADCEIRNERQRVKDDIATMVVDAMQKERENIQDKLYGHVTNDVANIVPSQVDSFLRDCMSNHILHVHLASSVSSSITDIQHQLYLKMNDDEQAQQADISIWLSLKI
nr:hypothetical protein [Tanacetum cinerariifolium]